MAKLNQCCGMSNAERRILLCHALNDELCRLPGHPIANHEITLVFRAAVCLIWSIPSPDARGGPTAQAVSLCGMGSASEQITQILEAAGAGDAQAAEERLSEPHCAQ